MSDDEPTWVKDPIPTPTTPLVNSVSPVIASSKSTDKFCGLDSVLCYFRIYHSFVCLVAAATFIENLYVLSQNNLNVREGAIRLFSLLFSLCIIAIEIDLKSFMVNISVLDNWFVRGILYAFLGFLTMDSTDKYTSSEDIIGFVMIFIGLVYIIMGLFGVKLIKDKRKNEYARSQS